MRVTLSARFRRNWVGHRGSADHRRLPKPQAKERRAVRFAGIPALERGDRRCRGSWDPVPVLVAEGGEQKPMSEAKSEEQ